MPNIKQFDTPALDIRPTEVGVESTAAAGRRLGGFFNQAGEALSNLGQRAGGAIKDAGDVYVSYKDHQEVSAGAASGTILRDNLNNEKDELIKGIDPNDPLYGQKVETAIKQWRETSLEPRLSTFREGFTTQNSQKWAEHFVDTTRSQFFNHTSAEIADAAGVGIKNAIKTTANVGSNTVYKSPWLLDGQLDLLRHSVNGMVETSPVKGVASAKIRTELLEQYEEQYVKSAVMGAIRSGGDWQSIADDKRYAKYIKPGEAEQFARAERSYQRMERAEQHQAKQDLDNEARTKFHTDLNKLEMSLFNDDGELVASKAQIAQFRKIVEGNERGAALEPGRVSSMFRGLQSMAEKTARIASAKDDTATKQDLTARMIDPDNPTTLLQIAAARNNGLLGPASTKNLVAIVKAQDAELHTPLFRDKMRDVRTILGTDPIGAEKHSAFMDDFILQYQAGKRAGTLQPNALNTKDETSLISQTMEKYKRTPMQMMMDKASHGMAPQDMGMETGGKKGTPMAATKAEYDALPPNTEFIGSDGRKYRKPPAPASGKP